MYVGFRIYLPTATNDEFVGTSLTQYLQAIGTRETRTIHSLNPPKQIAMFCGPKLYRPDAEKKLTALSWYQEIVDALIPKDTAITNPRLWHNDLHDDNIFVDSQNPEKITGIIDWQSCHSFRQSTVDPIVSLGSLSFDFFLRHLYDRGQSNGQ